MEGLGVAASIIAVINLSAHVTSYLTAVKGAKDEKKRLNEKVSRIGDILRDLQRLLHGPDGARLAASQELCNSLKDCFLQLKELEGQLTPGKTHKVMSRFGVQALKWPFKARDIQKIFNSLESFEQIFLGALQLDQTWVPNLAIVLGSRISNDISL